MMHFKDIQIKAEQSMLTSEKLLFCSPSTITAPMRFETGTLTKYHGGCKCGGDNIGSR